MSEQSLDHGRASFAWARVVDHADSEYATLAKSAPAMVMANGLLQSLAFLRSKAQRSDAHRRLCDDVLRWFEQPGSPLAPVDGSGDEDDGARYHRLTTGLVAATTDTYLRATEEALEILKWLRHLATAHQVTTTAPAGPPQEDQSAGSRT